MLFYSDLAVVVVVSISQTDDDGRKQNDREAGHTGNDRHWQTAGWRCDLWALCRGKIGANTLTEADDDGCVAEINFVAIAEWRAGSGHGRAVYETAVGRSFIDDPDTIAVAVDARMHARETLVINNDVRGFSAPES